MQISNTPSEKSQILYSSLQVEIWKELSEEQFNKIKLLIINNYKDEYLEELASVPDNMKHTTPYAFAIKKINHIEVKVINDNWLPKTRWYWDNYKYLYLNNPSLLVEILNIIAWEKHFLYDYEEWIIVYIWPWAPNNLPPNNRVSLIKGRTHKILTTWTADDYDLQKVA